MAAGHHERVAGPPHCFHNLVTPHAPMSAALRPFSLLQDVDMASEQKMSRAQLTAMVVGGMVGAGIFSLPRTFAGATGPLGAVIAWLIAGTGMYMLARVFQSLAERKPGLDAG